MAGLRCLHCVHTEPARFRSRARERFDIQTHDRKIVYGFGLRVPQSLSKAIVFGEPISLRESPRRWSVADEDLDVE